MARRCCGPACTARSSLLVTYKPDLFPCAAPRRGPRRPDLRERAPRAAGGADRGKGLTWSPWPARTCSTTGCGSSSPCPGVAFAVTLVLVQVGLFMGLLDKATVTIQNASADIWVTSRETPNVDFAHTFPETTVLRVRGVPGVAARRQPDRQLHEHHAAQSAPRRAASSTRSTTSAPGTCPGSSTRATQRDLRARALHPHGPLGRAALRDVLRRRLPRDPGPPLQDHRHHQRRGVLHDRAHRVHGLRQRAGAAADPAQPRQLRAGQGAAGRGRAAGGGRDPADRALQRRLHARGVGRALPHVLGRARPASA